MPISAFTCINTLLPTIGPFNLSTLDGGNGWGTADVGLAQTVQPIVYQNPWSASGTVVDPVSGYWIGSSWSVAPAGSWVVWGSNPDVAISTNLGVGWTTVAGQGGDGFTDQINDYSNSVNTNTASTWGNAECAGRNTFNRFYLIGNNGRNNASYPFFAWAANDAQSWTQVMDANSSIAMAALNGTAYPSCWVDSQDNVYFMGSQQVWMSTTLGRVWARLPSTTFPPPRQYMTSVIFAPTPTSETVITVGGQSTTTNLALNDVWLTTSYGASWTLAASAAAFSPRASPNVAVASNGAIVLHGGHVSFNGTTTWLSDMWVSVNQGSLWYLVTSSTGTARSMAGTIIDPYGYFYIDSGWGVNAAGVGFSWLGDVFKSTLSVNNIASWGPQLISGFTAPASFACTQGQANVTFDFVSTPGSPGWGAIDQFIRVTNVPTNYVTNYGSNNINDWATAPAGSWLLFGTQPDVSVSTNNGATWTITSGVASNNGHLDIRDIPPNFPGTVGAVAGNSGCSHRTTFNRFYIIGNVQGGLSGFGAPWFAWATQDGSVWYQVMNNASSYAMAYRVNASSPGNYPAQCFVSQTERVYSVGGADTWQSSDLGVSWTAVVSTSYFPSRINFAAAVYSPTPAQDTMVIMGGEGVQDCWQSVNGGASWTVVSAALPWGPRGNMNLGISQNSVFVVMGGDCRSGVCGPNGQTVASPGLQTWNDVWISVTYGSTWYQITPAASAPPLSLAAVAFDAAGFMYLVAGQSSGYGAWTANQYKSTQSLITIASWAPRLTTGQQFTPSSSFSTPTTGAYPLGGPKSAPTSAVKPQNSLPCGPQLGLPVPSGANAAPFDFVYADNTNGWPTADLGLAVIPAPIIYEVAYTNSSYGTYWQGNAWAIAPAGSWLAWGSQPDVAISVNQGSNWTTIAGVGNAGLPNTSTADYTPIGTSLLYNAECAHRATFNRFYLIGNGDPIGTYTQVPFFNWASNDGLTWTNVLDNATSYAMATTLDINSGQCVVGVNDVVYYIGGSAMWQSSNLGTTFTPIIPTAGATAYMNYTGLGARQNPTAVIYSPTVDTDTIVVLGGGGGYYSAFANDVWSTTNYGASWQMLTLRAGWSPRQSPQVAVGLNGVMVLYGGMAWTNSTIAGTYGWSWFSDIWVSLNGGSLWYPLNGQSVAGPRAYGAMMVDSGGFVYVSSGEATWGNWLASAYRSPYSLYNIQQWLPLLNASIPIPSTLCPTATASNVAYLCMIEYSLPGNVDYPWSSATSMSFSYLSGTNQVTIVSGAGSRTFINRFGVQRTVAFTVAPLGTALSNNVLYLSSTPFDSSGLTLTMASPIQFPGAGPLATSTQLTIKNVGGYVMEAQSSRVDTGGTAFLSNLPGFTNITIGASNINSLAASYGACQAPLTFTNGLRSPTQPSASNGATTFRYTYSIGDGATYTITGSLTFTASSAFATTVDQLGNPYQTITGVTGTRTYTWLATGQTVVSTVSGLSTAYGSPDQRFYPYSLIASAPGVYTVTTVPFFDAAGVEFNISPSAPAPGMAPGSGTQYSATWLYMATSEATAALTDGPATSMPVVTLQQQTYALGA